MIYIALRFCLVGLCLVLLWHWQLWSSLPAILEGDTLWHLSPIARVMLVTLATCAVVATALCCLVKSMYFEKRFYSGATWHLPHWIGALLIDFTITALLLLAAISLAPQLFYTLYVTVIPGLPQQWVARLIDFSTLADTFRLTPADSMSTLLVGVMLLTILVSSTLFWLRVLNNLFNSKQ